MRAQTESQVGDLCHAADGTGGWQRHGAPDRAPCFGLPGVFIAVGGPPDRAPLRRPMPLSNSRIAIHGVSMPL